MKLTGKAMWASFHQPNAMSNKYQVDLTQLSKADVDQLKEAGVEAKVGEDKKADYGHYVTAKANKPVPLFMADGNALAADKLIGNGSDITVAVNIYDWEFKGKTGKGIGLQAVKVNELKEYQQSGAAELFGDDTQLPF